MVINKKKKATLLRYHPKHHIQTKRKKLKPDLGHTRTHAHTHDKNSVHLFSGGCAVILRVHADGLNKRRSQYCHC